MVYSFCRMILAITHFNHNVNRAVKRRKDGTPRMKVSYPKFKNGQATVRNACVMQNFGKSTYSIMFICKTLCNNTQISSQKQNSIFCNYVCNILKNSGHVYVYKVCTVVTWYIHF